MADDTTNNELLSALLDGELTPEQQQAVEMRLESSEALRSELAQLREVSGLLAELPRQAAPADLRNTVMSQLSPGPQRASRRSAGGRLRSVLAMVTAAAALLLMLRLMPDGASPPNARSVSDETLVASSAPAAAEAASPAEADAMTPSGPEAGAGFAGGDEVVPSALGHAVPLSTSAKPETAKSVSSVVSDPRVPGDRNWRKLVESIEGSEIAMIGISSKKRDVRKLLDQALLQDQLVADRNQPDPAITESGVSAVVVHVRFDQLESVLGHIENQTGRDSLFVYGVKSRGNLEARLTAALAAGALGKGSAVNPVADADSRARKAGERVTADGQTEIASTKNDAKPAKKKVQLPGKRETTDIAVAKSVATGVRLVFVISAEQPVPEPCVDDAA